jgi:UDP-2,3-diacylglucosamine hydrolase
MSISKIEDGAIFVADAHYPNHGDEFLRLLEMIEREEILTKQLFLVGDIFDLLFGYNSYIQTFSKDAIELIKKLSKRIEIYYIEGNHDFSLKDIFKNIKVYNYKMQPIKFCLNDKIVYISHGDFSNSKFSYRLYSRVIRSRAILTMLKPFQKYIIDYQINRLKRKKVCFKFKLFKEKVKNIIQEYPENSLIIEGHFHQGKVFENYISLPSLACQKQIGIVYNDKIIFKDINSLSIFEQSKE